MNEEFDFRAPTTATVHGRPVHGRRRSRSTHPVTAYGLRITADGATSGLLRRHRHLRRAGRDCAATPTCFLCRGVLPRRRRQPARPAPDRRRLRRRSPPRPASRRLVLTHVPPWHDPGDRAGRGARGPTTARSSWRGPGDDLRDLSPLRAQPARRRARRSRSAPGWSTSSLSNSRADVRLDGRHATGRARAAISALLSPRPTASATSCSRSVSRGEPLPRRARCGRGRALRGACWIRVRVTVGESIGSPAATLRIASTISAGGGVLEQEAVGAGGQRPHHVVVGVEGGQHDHPRRVGVGRAARGSPRARPSPASGCRSARRRAAGRSATATACAAVGGLADHLERRAAAEHQRQAARTSGSSSTMSTRIGGLTSPTVASRRRTNVEPSRRVPSRRAAGSSARSRRPTRPSPAPRGHRLAEADAGCGPRRRCPSSG